MASNVTAARHYAQAVLELGLEHGDLDTWRQDLMLLAHLWADPALRAHLEDVRISKQARLDRARQRLETFISPRALNMVLMLIARGTSALIPFIARQFEDLERQREQTVVALVTSASELTPGQRADLVQQLERHTGKGVQVQAHVDPSIVGGLVIKIGDQLLDLSVAGRLNRMREQIVGRRAAAG